MLSVRFPWRTGVSGPEPCKLLLGSGGAGLRLGERRAQPRELFLGRGGTRGRLRDQRGWARAIDTFEGERHRAEARVVERRAPFDAVATAGGEEGLGEGRAHLAQDGALPG